MSAIANVTTYVDAATAHVKTATAGMGTNVIVDGKPIPGTPEIAYLELTDLRALLERLADVCPVHGSCAVCKTTLCEPCGVGEYATCGHQDAELLCDECRHDECPDCRSEMRAEFGVDRYFRSAS